MPKFLAMALALQPTALALALYRVALLTSLVWSWIFRTAFFSYSSLHSIQERIPLCVRKCRDDHAAVCEQTTDKNDGATMDVTNNANDAGGHYMDLHSAWQ